MQKPFQPCRRGDFLFAAEKGGFPRSDPKPSALYGLPRAKPKHDLEEGPILPSCIRWATWLRVHASIFSRLTALKGKLLLKGEIPGVRAFV